MSVMSKWQNKPKTQDYNKVTQTGMNVYSLIGVISIIQFENETKQAGQAI